MRRAGFLLGSSAAALWPRCAAAGTLNESVARLDQESSGRIAVYARALGDSEPLVSYHADDDFPAASTIKLVIMVALFRLQEASRPSLFAERIIMKAENYVGGSEILDRTSPGQPLSIGYLMNAMITVSDNTASNALIDFLGFDAINATAAAFGLEHTHLRRHFLDGNAIVHKIQNRTSARDMGRLVYKIETGSHEAISTVASATACRRMIGIMLHQEDRDKIPRALPKTVQIANKTGEIDGVRNDVAIVSPFGDKPYVIAVLSKELQNYDSGLRAIHTVAREVHGSLG